MSRSRSRHQDKYSDYTESEPSSPDHDSISSNSSFNDHRAKFRNLIGRMDDLKAFKEGVIKQSETVVSDDSLESETLSNLSSDRHYRSRSRPKNNIKRSRKSRSRGRSFNKRRVSFKNDHRHLDDQEDSRSAPETQRTKTDDSKDSGRGLMSQRGIHSPRDYGEPDDGEQIEIRRKSIVLSKKSNKSDRLELSIEQNPLFSKEDVKIQIEDVGTTPPVLKPVTNRTHVTEITNVFNCHPSDYKLFNQAGKGLQNMVDQSFVTQTYANNQPYKVTTIDDDYNFSSPIKINPNKVKAHQEAYISKLESTKVKDHLEPNEEEKEKYKKMMDYMDGAIEKKKLRKKKALIEEEKIKKYLSEMISVVESNHLWIKKSIKGFKLLYSQMNMGGKVLPTKAKAYRISSEYKSRIKKVVRRIMKGSLFKIRDIDRVFEEIREGEMNFILDQVSLYLSQEFDPRFNEDKHFLLCEFVACIVLFVHETYKYDGCLEDGKCKGGCLNLFILRLRSQGIKRGFPIIRKINKNFKSKKLHYKDVEKENVNYNSKGVFQQSMENNKGTKFTPSKKGKKSNLEMSLEYRLNQSMSKYKVDKDYMKSRIFVNDEKIILDNLKPLLMNFVANSDFSSLQPRFVLRIFHRSILRALKTTFEQYGIYRSKKAGNMNPNFANDRYDNPLPSYPRHHLSGKLYGQNRDAFDQHGSMLHLRSALNLEKLESAMDRIILLSNKMIGNKELVYCSQQKLGTHFRKQLKWALEGGKGRAKSRKVQNSEVQFNNIFEEIYAMDEQLIKDEALDPKSVDSKCFSKTNASIILKKYGQLNSFGHYLLMIMLSMKYLFYGKETKHRFIQVFLDQGKHQIERVINYPWISLQFIKSTNYNSFYKQICLKWERLIKPYFNKNKDLPLQGLFEYTKTLSQFTCLVPVKQLGVVFKSALVLYINEFYDEDCRLQKENMNRNEFLVQEDWDASTIYNKASQINERNKNNLHDHGDRSVLENVNFELDFFGRKNLIFLLSGELVPAVLDRHDKKSIVKAMSKMKLFMENLIMRNKVVF